MNNNAATQAQRNYIVNLTDQLDITPAESYRIATQKLTKTSASQLIDDLKSQVGR